MEKKQIVLIRHGQSEENVKIQSAMEGIRRLGSGKLPHAHSFSSAAHLARLQTGYAM
jgi:broad specificity phosphatase PhoE